MALCYWLRKKRWLKLEDAMEWKWMWKKIEVMRISRQPFPVKIIIDQKQLENVESFKYLNSILTNDGRCTCGIKCRIAMAKAAFNKKRALFTSTLDLKLEKKLIKCYIWSIALYSAETWTVRAVDQKQLWKFWNVVLEKDGEDQLDRSCEKWRSIA